MRLSADLRDAIEAHVDIIRLEHPGENAQALLAQALRSAVVAQEIDGRVDWLVDHSQGEEAA